MVRATEPLKVVPLAAPVPALLNVAAFTTEPAEPVVFWFRVGTSPAWIVDITTFDPLPRRYWPLVTAPAKAFMAACAEVWPDPPLAIASVPPSVIVPEVVTGPPLVVSPVVPPDTSTEVTVPSGLVDH